MEKLCELRSLLSNLKETRRKVSKELSRAPKGVLLIIKDRGYTVYRQSYKADCGCIRKSIGKDPELVMALAHKRYLTEKLKRLDRNIELIERAYRDSVSLSEEDIMDIMPGSFARLDKASVILGHRAGGRGRPHPVREGVFPVDARLKIDPDDRFDWGSRPYAENASFSENKRYVSPGGLLCRSKSEAAILGIYDSLGIPYHYDEIVYVSGVRLSPDIIGCSEDGALIFHEHKGLSSEEYQNRSEYKERKYREAGIIPGKNLILTYDREDGTVNLALIRDIIKDTYRM